MFSFLIGNFRLYAVLGVVMAVLAAFWYVSGLRGDLAESEANNQKLKDAVQVQQQAIDQLKKDSDKIRAANDTLTATVRSQNKDLENLRKRFKTDSEGKERNFGQAAAKNPAAVEKETNALTKSMERCLEIASGAPLTEKEKNAKQLNEINQECPGLANPSYRAAK